MFLHRRHSRIRSRSQGGGNRRRPIPIRHPARIRPEGARNQMVKTIQRRLLLVPQATAPGAAGGAGDSPAALTITSIKTYALREPKSRRAYTILEAQTKSGLIGYGECAPASPEALT